MADKGVKEMTKLDQWHTWQEIHAQPAIWEAFLPEIMAQRDDLRDWIKASDVSEVWFSGAGTSAYIGDFLAAGLATSNEMTFRSVASTDLVSAPTQFVTNSKPLVVNFGRSGNSAETIGVLNVLDALLQDAPRLNITCNAESVLATRQARRARTIVLPDDTHDKGFAMTSSYTTMLLTALTIFSPDVRPDAGSDLATRLRAALPEFAALAQDMAMPSRIVVVGSGALRFMAREAALKIMELTAGKIPVLWDTSLGFRHGPKSFVTPGTHVLSLTSADPDIARYDRDLVVELRKQFDDISVSEIAPTDMPDLWGGVLQATAAQIIAATLSSRLGLNVDDPFSGQGTLTRVVADVRLYPPAAS